MIANRDITVISSRRTAPNQQKTASHLRIIKLSNFQATGRQRRKVLSGKFLRDSTL